jgi:hypothetical protein
MRAPAGSDRKKRKKREREKGKMGRRREAGWAGDGRLDGPGERGREVGRGLGLGLDRFCCFFVFFQIHFKPISNPF